MTFDDWFHEWRLELPFAPDEKHIKRLCNECWEAAQKEAARRCAEISAQQGTAVTYVVSKFIEREFGLDRHE